MGAVTAILFAEMNNYSHQVHLSSLVLDSPFADINTLAQDVADQNHNIPSVFVTMAMAIVKSTIRDKLQFDVDDLKPYESIKNVKIPSLFHVGKYDVLVRPFRVQAYFNRFNGNQKKRYIETECDHGGEREENYYIECFKFVDDCFSSEDFAGHKTSAKNDSDGTSVLKRAMNKVIYGSDTGPGAQKPDRRTGGPQFREAGAATYTSQLRDQPTNASIRYGQSPQPPTSSNLNQSRGQDKQHSIFENSNSGIKMTGSSKDSQAPSNPKPIMLGSQFGSSKNLSQGPTVQNNSISPLFASPFSQPPQNHQQPQPQQSHQHAQQQQNHQPPQSQQNHQPFHHPVQVSIVQPHQQSVVQQGGSILSLQTEESRQSQLKASVSQDNKNTSSASILGQKKPKLIFESDLPSNRPIGSSSNFAIIGQTTNSGLEKFRTPQPVSMKRIDQVNGSRVGPEPAGPNRFERVDESSMMRGAKTINDYNQKMNSLRNQAGLNYYGEQNQPIHKTSEITGKRVMDFTLKSPSETTTAHSEIGSNPGLKNDASLPTPPTNVTQHDRQAIANAMQSGSGPSSFAGNAQMAGPSMAVTNGAAYANKNIFESVS